MTIQEYLSSLRGKTAAVLGIGESNTPLIELLCRNGVQVIACDKKSREDLGERVKQLEALGAHLQLGEGYLDDLRADVVSARRACGRTFRRCSRRKRAAAL